VGANSVVARDVPDFCVVAGAPARIVKRHDPSSGSWTTVLRDALLDAQS
jgi:acetyltransferase-like isoleucine patch superfamily enzyme